MTRLQVEVTRANYRTLQEIYKDLSEHRPAFLSATQRYPVEYAYNGFRWVFEEPQQFVKFLEDLDKRLVAHKRASKGFSHSSPDLARA